MRQVTETFNVYKFDELSDTAKDNVRFRATEDTFWHEFVTDDVKRMGDVLGIDIDNVYWQIDGQGYGACFTGDYRYKPGSVKAMASEAPETYTDQHGEIHESPGNTMLNQVARDLATAQKSAFYRVTFKITQHGNYCHKHSMMFAGDDYGPALPDQAENDVVQALHDFADWIYYIVKAEADYRISDEALSEDAELNGWEFYEDGKMFVG